MVRHAFYVLEKLMSTGNNRLEPKNILQTLQLKKQLKEIVIGERKKKQETPPHCIRLIIFGPLSIKPKKQIPWNDGVAYTIFFTPHLTTLVSLTFITPCPFC